MADERRKAESVTSSRPSLRVRLLALVLVPTVLFGIVAGFSSRSQWQDAARARKVQHDVSDLAGLVDLKSALLLARVPVEVDVRASSIGLDSAAARELLGLDPAQVGSFDDVTGALRRLPRRDRPFAADAVSALAARADAGSSPQVLGGLDELDAATDRVWEARLAELRAEIVGLGDPRLAAQLADLQSAAVVGGATTALLTGLAGYWFPGERGVPSERARVTLGVAADRLDRSLGELEASPDPDVAAAASGIRADGAPFLQAIEGAVSEASSTPPAVDVAQAAAVFKTSFDLFGPILDVVESRSADLESTADASANGSTTAARRTLAVAVLVPVLILAASLALVASIERPLRRLIGALRQVGAGELDTPPVPATGPPELGAAATAFNEVVQNLQLVERKVRVLAEPQLDDPVMDHPLPGELGRTLTPSFDVLDESIRDRASLHVELAHQATHDALTGIANRAGILAALERAIERLARSESTLLVAFLDLDRFKAVNDTHGHRHGDDVLCEVAARLAGHARAGDVAGRLGGDEFVLIAENIPNGSIALQLAERIAHAVARPIQIGEGQVRVGASVGLALASEPGESAAHLLDRADRAAYAAKRSASSISVSTGPESAPTPLL
ncbi:MAG: diguanylate cyclase [Acidimicrobiales bacterium]|nr:diguanylate cyclase [Actinomycetota bacterium]